MIPTNLNSYCPFPFIPFTFGQFILPNDYNFISNSPTSQPNIPITSQNIQSNNRITNQSSIDQSESKSHENIDNQQRNPVNHQLSKKNYKKNLSCPAHYCKKKYSSRIALRSHLRKVHPNWAEETSDYQP